MEVGLAHGDREHGARLFAELHHFGEKLRLCRYGARAADTQRLVDARHEKDQLHEAAAFDDVPEAVDAVVARAVGHQEMVRPVDMNETGTAAARGGIDAAVDAGGREHAERRHRDELLRMRIDRGPRLCDYARRRFWIDRGEIFCGYVGHGGSPDFGAITPRRPARSN